MAATTIARPQKRSRLEPPTLTSQPDTLSLDMIEAPTTQNLLNLSSLPQTTLPESWAGFDFGEATTPSAFLPPTSSYDFSIPNSQDTFSMGDFLQGNLAFGTPKFDGSMWGLDLAQSPSASHLMKTHDYFNLSPTSQPAHIIAPEELTASSTVKVKGDSTNPTTAAAQPSVKVPKKRGRKRKVLDEKAQVVERKKFLERNRVAANRCRERKKSYVSNLESKQKEILAKNQFLRHELESLSQEVGLLKKMVHVKCACSEEVLVQNLKAGLRESTQSQDDIAEVVAKFKTMRATGITAGTGVEPFLKEMGPGSPCPSTSPSVNDDLFSFDGEVEEQLSSTQSSPVEVGESKNLGYPTL